MGTRRVACGRRDHAASADDRSLDGARWRGDGDSSSRRAEVIRVHRGLRGISDHPDRMDLWVCAVGRRNGSQCERLQDARQGYRARTNVGVEDQTRRHQGNPRAREEHSLGVRWPGVQLVWRRRPTHPEVSKTLAVTRSPSLTGRDKGSEAMNRLKDWLQRGELIMVVGAGVIVLVAYIIRGLPSRRMAIMNGQIVAALSG